jgi:hypothetical protein
MITSGSGRRLGRLTRRAGLAAALAAVTLSLAAATARAAVGPAAAARPPGRSWPSFAYDPPRREFVLFGGENGSTVLGDTWIHKDGAWTQLNPARSPSPRTGAAMVYDAATGQLLLFGGSSFTGSPYYRDTWVWTGRTWRRLHPATSPPARHNADMIYDAATHNVVLFGGYDGQYLGDTWTWNGTTWTQQNTPTGPAPRDTGSFVYDAATGTGIVYGGFNGVTSFTDTWSWNGSSWTQLSPATSPDEATFGWQAAYDGTTQQIIMFGQSSGQTWAWTGSTWTQLAPATSPPPQAVGAMSYDSTTQQIVFASTVVAAGHFHPVSPWSWDGSTWHRGI